MQSKYIPHYVNNKAKIGHLNTRSHYPKIDEIRCVVDKNNFDIFVSWNLVIWIHKELEQLERLRSETPRPMITHTSDSHQIPSQKKTKSKLQI